MTRAQLEHLIRAAAVIAGWDKDLHFLAEAVRLGMADREILFRRLGAVDFEQAVW